ncbi:MAG: hypothetical protein H6741_16155 [Alphaproteobacteria bacterium]|nr:hypothetical protein [Alphaproteobacteria bacterium]MCB9794247.1 hypothetical protein [Alphaproteobacteria bacterium]
MPETDARLVAHRGEVIDLSFPEGAAPEPMSLVEVSREGPPLRAEVAGPLTGGRVRALVLDEPWGLRTGAPARAAGPLLAPAGEAALGRLMDLTGRFLDDRPNIDLPLRPVHAPRPALAPSEGLLPTGWAALELLSPLPRGGSAAALDLDGQGLSALLTLAGQQSWTAVLASVGQSSAELLALHAQAEAQLTDFALLAAPAAAPAAARARLPLSSWTLACALAEAGREVVLLLVDARMAHEAQGQAQDLLGRRLSWTTGPALQAGLNGSGALTFIELQRALPRQAPQRLLETDISFALDGAGPDPARCQGSRAWPGTRGLRRRIRLTLQGLEEGWLRASDKATALALREALRASAEAPEPWAESAARWSAALEDVRV